MATAAAVTPREAAAEHPAAAACSPGLLSIGVLHFAVPGPFVAIELFFLPAPLVLVLVSGFFEVLGGAGLLVPRVRRAASIGLVLLYVAVFPANINMTMHPEISAPYGIPLLLWARLPLQALFIAAASGSEAAATSVVSPRSADRIPASPPLPPPSSASPTTAEGMVKRGLRPAFHHILSCP